MLSPIKHKRLDCVPQKVCRVLQHISCGTAKDRVPFTQLKDHAREWDTGEQDQHEEREVGDKLDGESKCSHAGNDEHLQHRACA